MIDFKIGYIFKPTHDEIHFLRKGANGDMRRKYDKNFTTKFELAETFKNEEKAREFIVKLVAKFPIDDDYIFTPVLINSDTKTFQRFIHKKWNNEAINSRFIS